MRPDAPSSSQTADGSTNPFETREYEASQGSAPSTTETSSVDSSVCFCLWGFFFGPQDTASSWLLTIIKSSRLPVVSDAVVPPVTLEGSRRSIPRALSSASLEIVSTQLVLSFQICTC